MDLADSRNGVASGDGKSVEDWIVYITMKYSSIHGHYPNSDELGFQ